MKMIKNEKHFMSSKCIHENKNALRQTKKIIRVYVCVYKGLLCQKTDYSLINNPTKKVNMKLTK